MNMRDTFAKIADPKGRPPRVQSVTKSEEAAYSDPDAMPVDDAVFDASRKVARVKTLRRALGLTQDEFASKFHIPVGTLRDWEQGRSQPDRPALAYLKVIASEPAAVLRALGEESFPSGEAAQGRQPSNTT